MLVGFSVSNYKSFKEGQKISFEASKITRHKAHVAVNQKKRILKSGLIFGANAGGKSNLVKAIRFSREIILNGLDKVNLSKSYFRIDPDMYKQPGIFEYRIVVGESEYSYGIAISYSDKTILSEWLIRIDNLGKEIYLFNREVDENNISHSESEIEYSSMDEKYKMNFYLEGFSEDMSEAYKRKSILSDIALRANEKTGIFAEIRKVYEWFENIIILFPNSKYNGLNEVAADRSKKLFFSSIMGYFDTGIESVEGESQQMDFDKVLNSIPREDAEKIKIDISNAANEHPIMFKIDEQVFELRKDENGNIVYNKLLLNHGNAEDMFDYNDESDGTKRLFDLIPLFYENRKVSLILIDEIDRSLHTNLTRKFLELFYEVVAEKECQIIATTHDSNLLDLELLRQDEIWFVERQEDHSSKVFSLNRFKERFDKKIDKEYLIGRYGAIPVFDDNFTLEEIYEE
ncbi:MAG: ATP-binding protein [Lachnospiraceae bacterium]|nr:ATP-binding protein [Lachnospiraceae bacterium]